MPAVGDIVDGNGFQAMVRKMRRNRVLLILIEKSEQAPEAAPEPAASEEVSE